MSYKFLTNVTHEGILFKEGSVVAALAEEVAADLVKRGLAEVSQEAATHSTALASGSSEAVPIDSKPAAAPAPAPAPAPVQQASQTSVEQQIAAEAANIK